VVALALLVHSTYSKLLLLLRIIDQSIYCVSLFPKIWRETMALVAEPVITTLRPK
jgi:hypothetical protein